ncbi:MAG: ABC transporter ATP-binding protein [Candidatus Bathyarchaeia archaeon]|nr:ABC transporter ATP-binding protein [Candidatus Bathyarchaeota archaeon]
MPTIKLVNVTKRYGDIVAIKNLSMTIHDGEYICILGPTGSGKTTLLKLIAGIIKPDKGEIYIDGKLVNDVPPYERNIAYLPQYYALFPHLTALENVAFGPLSRGIDVKEAYKISMQILEMMRLAWRARSYPHELSGGMQQRLALARALASGAKILLLDEPLSALDARLRVELRYNLRKIAKENNLTTIHVTHDQEETMVVADRIIVLRNGEIQQEGTPLQVYNEPKNVFVAHFIGESNFFDGFVIDVDQYGSWVQLRNGLLLRTNNVDRSVGDRVVVMVREEKSRILKATKKREEINLLPGVIINASFLGNFISYTILLDNGDKVNSKMPTINAIGKFSIGERVYLKISPEDLRVYPYPALGLYRELEVM